MTLSDEQLQRAYEKCAPGRPMPPVGLVQARVFIEAIFDELPVAGYLDPDGSFAEEEWGAGADCVEVFRRPE